MFLIKEWHQINYKANIDWWRDMRASDKKHAKFKLKVSIKHKKDYANFVYTEMLSIVLKIILLWKLNIIKDILLTLRKQSWNNFKYIFIFKAVHNYLKVGTTNKVCNI